jgi:iron complex transport system ATP-binding protein
VRWSGTPLAELRGRKIARLRAFIPQRAPVPAGVTVREAVELGRSPHIKPLARPTRHDRDAVDRALERTGVYEFAERRLTTLSGGELQRVQIAVGLAQEAPVLIADEPTSHLDLGATASVARLLRGLADDGLSVILVVHDLALAAAVADTVVVMADGRSAATGPPRDVLTPERLSEVWRVDAALDDRGALHVNWLDR